MFYNMRFTRLPARESAKLAVESAQIFWHQTRLPIRKEQKMINQLMKIYEQWKSIQKTAIQKRSSAQKK